MDLTEARFRAGEVPLPDLTTARIDLTSPRQTLSTAEGQVQTTHAALAAAIGVPDSSLAGKNLVWEDDTTPPAPDLLPSLAARELALETLASVYQKAGRYNILHDGARRVQTITLNVAGNNTAAFENRA